MINTLKTFVIFLALVLLPMTSTTWAYELTRDDGHAHHRHDWHFHANPDLTLISGMDNIDTRVLVDPAPDPEQEEMDQSAPEDVAPTPAQTIGSDMDTFIVNVPNNAGGYTPVRIQKAGNGYLGPQGELYYPFPEVSQLKAMYGL